MTFIYIIACLIIIAFVTIATEIEWFGWSTLTLIGSVIAAHYLHVFELIPYVKTHLLNSIIYTICYIGIGIFWSFPKWFFFLRNERDKTREYLNEQQESSYGWANPPKINIPQASDNKGKIIAWMIYWPFSLVGTLLNDPVRKLFNLIFDQFKNLYQKMADSIFKEDVQQLNLKIHRAKDKQNLAEKIINQNGIS